jgi:hypothetical protein
VARDFVGVPMSASATSRWQIVPQDDGGDAQVEAGCAIGLVREPPITQLAELVEEEGSVANSDTVSKIGLMYCQGQLR